ncbi:helix-turn-helix transcriptional regulator [Microbacterium sp. SSW1-59]|uniref:helix-turn-helix transcriptional regulator n=1 Tax=Microbacterium xanthum TaxID=3079794 RepID=UPI002AD2324D|nr:helix-turn-helix transcriptional regulator [Microbacterium sp. SSW1-59]MDZ8201208.1 helix-turn-helix transcriptional regulator [Microbacterium sp. SSW1-59]
MDRDALANFLRRHRASLQPSDVGLGSGTRRRAPGLRREEVAHLATMSTDYYTRLEQRRGPQPSTQVLTALARALRLTTDERDYLFRIAGHAAPDRHTASTLVSPALRRVFDRLDDTPALIISTLGETLEQNALAVALFGDDVGRRGWERYEAYRWFVGDARSRAHYPASYHPQQSRALASGLRAAVGEMGSASVAGDLAAVLVARSDEFRTLWEQQVVARRFADRKTLLHPEVGAIEVDCQALFTEDRSQALLVLTPRAGNDATEKIRLLAVVGTQSFGS